MADIAQSLIQSLAEVLSRQLARALLEPYLDERGPNGELQPNPLYREMSASEQEVVRKLLSDNSVTLASVQRGDFGAAAQRLVQEDFPFAGDPQETGRVFQ